MINYARLRKAVEKLYEHTATVSRYGKGKKPSGETTLRPQVVYDNVPCRVSQKALGPSYQSESVNEVTYETKLFISPDIEIKPGDEINVKGFPTYTAGGVFSYGSHQEVTLSKRGKA